jgi:hypothetical protein
MIIKVTDEERHCDGAIYEPKFTVVPMISNSIALRIVRFSYSKNLHLHPACRARLFRHIAI